MNLGRGSSGMGVAQPEMEQTRVSAGLSDIVRLLWTIVGFRMVNRREWDPH
jgi:hypothetical protein